MKIIVAIDESPCSEAALDALLARNWDSETEVLLLTVLQPIASSMDFAPGYMITPLLEPDPAQFTQMQTFMDEKVHQLQSVFTKDRVFGKTIQGDPADIIIDYAKSWDADLVLVGSHGRKGFEKFLLGSVAEKVAKNAPCSVEIVRQKLPRALDASETETGAGVRK
ncbi:MAG: universal stress protein [Candidatus Obscuribacterales bacterium]|nr:universal stress protein [Candidatus Obscuribacterales bacterium]